VVLGVPDVTRLPVALVLVVAVLLLVSEGVALEVLVRVALSVEEPEKQAVALWDRLVVPEGVVVVLVDTLGLLLKVHLKERVEVGVEGTVSVAPLRLASTMLGVAAPEALTVELLEALAMVAVAVRTMDLVATCEAEMVGE